MYTRLLEESGSHSIKESRQSLQIKKVIQLLMANHDGLTLDFFCNKLKISTPTGIKLVNEMVKRNLIQVSGKKETENGRRPSLYTLNKKNFYAIGVEVLLKRISFIVVDIEFQEVFSIHDRNFRLKNEHDSLESVISFIRDSFSKTGLRKESILGIGMSITGRINTSTGISYNFFDFMDMPLAEYLKRQLKFEVVIDNDTHTLALAEQIIGKVKNIKNAIVVNVSRGLGASIILNNQVVTGGMGFAGEFGHMQFNNSEKMCICGKKGCLGTFVSGFGIEEEFKAQMTNGGKSIIEANWASDSLRYDDIITAALAGDALSISLIQGLGLNLGKALGNLVNLMNPQKIVLSGKFARLGGMLLNSTVNGMTLTALPNPLQACIIEISDFKDNGGLIGSGLLVYKFYQLI